MSQPIRSTQRAPKSCTACYKRKVKCSKGIPCQQCAARGQPDACRRELVSVRGQLRTADTPGDDSSYQKLLQENLRLQGLVGQAAAYAHAQDGPRDDEGQSALFQPIEDRTEMYEKTVFTALARFTPPRTVHSEQDILMASRTCSDQLVEYAMRWTSWVHFAVLTPQFYQDYSTFWKNSTPETPLSGFQPLWLAVYFSILASALIFMDDSDLAITQPPTSDRTLLLLNWYESALWLLNKGDFMRQPHIHSVQAIAILGIVFRNVGDAQLNRTMWAVAVRIAQDLNLGSDSAHAQGEESYADQQARRRLWWTLVICEWLPIPYRVPCINDVDFDCRLPDNVDDGELAATMAPSRLSKSKPRPVQYHIVMGKVARIYHHLRYKLRIRRWSPQEFAGFVLTADDQLANIIEELPAYINFGKPETAESRERDAQHLWIPWQKKNLKLVLLYYRININRLLQGHWHSETIHAARTRAICLSTAQAIIRETLEETVDDSKLKPWHISTNVFSAAVTLALEMSAADAADLEISVYIEQALKFLQRVSAQNPVAEQSIAVLRSLIERQ